MLKNERGRRSREETRVSMAMPPIRTNHNQSLNPNGVKVLKPLIRNLKAFRPPLKATVAQTSVKDNESRPLSAVVTDAHELQWTMSVGFEPGKLYTTGQAAAVTGLSTKAFEAWRLKGVGGPPYIKLGKAVRYQGEDLLAWIAANRRHSTSEG
ncbi:MAG TPA: helix-turn-helix domain-containing protein [Azospirillum sp.]|nr:helix-turn-helix domain-containing protein [Azospirillum sp.]